MDNIAGPPVEGANFFGRQSEIEALLRDLEHHDVLLLGPRRIGKTSVARATLAAAREKDRRGFEINVAACEGEVGFVGRLHEAAENAVRSWLGKAFARLKDRAAGLAGRIKKLRVPHGPEIELGSAPEEDWTVLAADTVRLLADADHRWLVYVDELPILLYNILRNDPGTGVARVRRFLDWFRNDVRALPGCEHIRWLVTGSVGLDTLVQRHGMADTVNTLRHRGLPPFDPTVAAQMLHALAETHRVALRSEDASQIVADLGWPQPYYLQRVFHSLRDAAHAGAPVSREAIAAAVLRLTDADEDNDFHHWEKRLELQLGPVDAAHAVALLTLAAETRAGARPPFLLDRLASRMGTASADEQRQKFIDLRDVLARDQYWCADESTGERRLRFQLEPLRVWWQRRHAL